MSTSSRCPILLSLFAVLSLYGCNRHSDQGGESSSSTHEVRSVEWYQNHPEDLKADEGKCAGEAPILNRDACQNVYSAETNLGVKEMEDAAHNNAARVPQNPK